MQNLINNTMKLIDLQEIFTPTETTIFSNRKFRPNYDPNPTKRELGRGKYSVVADDPADPHMVKKRQLSRSDTDNSKDLYTTFAKTVVAYKLWNKIHFPRIYEIKVLQDKDHKQLFKWRIEKLHDIYTLSPEEFDSLINRYFTRDIVQAINKSPERMCDIMRSMIVKKDFSNVEDEQFKTCMAIISKMIQSFQSIGRYFKLDLHSGNIMVRRTSVGPQLVITDPFSG